MEIYIVRHGQTYWNTQRRLQGLSDTELNEDGIRIAKLTGEALQDVHFDRVYSSPLKRAYDTACYIMAGHENIQVIKDPRLIEMTFGQLEGQCLNDFMNDPSSQMYKLFRAPGDYEPDATGESFADLVVRAGAFLKDEIEPLEKSCQRIMLVGHGAVNKAMMCNIKGLPLDEFWTGGVQKNCNVIILRLENGEYTIETEEKVFY